MRVSRMLAAVAMGTACLLSGGCLEDPPPKPLPMPCFRTCPTAPKFEKLGEFCTLGASYCIQGQPVCIYYCEDIETREPIELELRIRPRGPLLTDKYPADGGGAKAKAVPERE